MRAWYNENDKSAAAWLRELERAGHIPAGDVDERSITDVRAADLYGYTQCHFFAGIGGWPLALRLAGWDDARPVWTGSCPCQPFSNAGKRRGFADDRHLWPVWRRLIEERRPAIVFGEQVASAADWLRLVRGDLETMAYAVGAMPIEAASAGADHLRDRFWFVAHAALPKEKRQRRDRREILSEQEATGHRGPGLHGFAMAHAHELCAGEGRQQRSGQLGGSGSDPQARAGALPNSSSEQVGSAGQPRQRGHVAVTDREGEPGLAQHGEVAGIDREFDWVVGTDGKARRVKPGVRLLAHGIPARVAKLRGFGNAIDPRPTAAFIKASVEAMSALANPGQGVAA